MNTGSVSLWNIETCTGKIDSFETEVSEPEILEPQRRFQDADTVGKQEAFDWGCGWVAIRAVAWSPFDDHIFATTGNDSVFKVWDVREPRVCLRSHRIRSTWGLALQWMDQTSIQISGDQGSVYMYDILSGSYQKLHYHPQIDSPVWDLQFARRGAIPLLVSACTSGSIRAAPAKKLFRSPQNCVEICRLSGEKDASIEKPFKALTISFQKHSVVGSADPVKQTSREFCERDAALHRLRLSSSTTGDYPCFLAAGGHAGLVILLEVQKTLDTLISTFFYAPKRLGRPKKICTTEKNTVSSKMGGGKTKGTRSTGKKTRTLGGSFAKAKSMRTAVSKYTKKLPLKAKAKGKRLRRQVLANSFLQDDGAVEAVGCVEEEEESEFEGDEDEDESEMSMVLEDSSDDDRIRDSDDDVEDEMETMVEDVNPEEARLMKEYQLDLSEEDAYLLALQLSETTDAAGVETSDGKTPKAETNIGKPDSTPVSRETERSETHVTSARTTAQANGLAGKAAGKGKKRARPVHSTSVATDSAATKLDVVIKAKKKIKVQVGDSDTPECKASSVVAPGSSAESLTRAVSNKTKRKSKQPSEAPTRKVFTAKTDKRNPLLLHQTMALQSYAYQKGMSEEDALKEAIRLSAMDGKPRSVCDNHLPSDPAKGALPTPTQPKQTPATPRTKVTKQMKAKVAKETVTVGEPDAVFFAAKDGPQQRLPQTPRRLEFSPLNESEGVGPIEIPTANIDSEILGPELAGSCQLDAAHTALAVTKLPCSSSFSSEAATANSMAPLSSAQTSSSNEPEGVETKEAALTSFSNSKQPSMFSRTSDKSSKARGSTRKGKSSTSRGGRRKPSSSAAPTSDEDAMLLAIQLSKVEY
ncbi:hypothetical protein PsorP6_006576 [Peronosclerospora sorghi]|uniref:Uncharacterized protein n=1 Tax=Peronosclerospora sorghi TaxID=230839 RepID=A0ACC0W242_9STRA|nr:hypothetical protein PsorP6_006576 [Peronosclerospora sorghi]